MSEHVYYKKPKKGLKEKKKFETQEYSASTNLHEREKHNTQSFKNIF